MKTKIAVVQSNPKVGDLSGNIKAMLADYIAAMEGGAELVVFPEMVVTGYPIEDLALSKTFVTAAEHATVRFIKAVEDAAHGMEPLDLARISARPGPPVIFGTLRSGVHTTGNLIAQNVAMFFDPATGQSVCSVKSELPNYGVFDEKRVFTTGDPTYAAWGRYKIGLMVCEDGWFPNVSRRLKELGVDFIVSINGSPFEIGKNAVRERVIIDRLDETDIPILYANMVGGQDELVFDGGSFLIDHDGIQRAPEFKSGVFYFEHEMDRPTSIHEMGMLPVAAATGLPSVYRALVLGLRDYMAKQGFTKVVLGYSGGVDSGLVAAIACDAIGPQNVHLVRLPSKYSSDGSLDDAAMGAERLGAPMRTIPIEPIVDALRVAYAGSEDHGHYPEYFSGDQSVLSSLPRRKLAGVADENIQARARGNILMAISNQEGHLLLTTGNRSECLTSNCTLYGDMCGGFNVLKDIYKTTVWDLCRLRNEITAEGIAELGFLGPEAIVVPEEIISKPPSAELAPDQLDENLLGTYDRVDRVLKALVDGRMSIGAAVEETGYEHDYVAMIQNRVFNSEYKRRQGAPGVKVTGLLLNRDRRYPIVNGWR